MLDAIMMPSTLHIQNGKFQHHLIMSKTENQDWKRDEELNTVIKNFGDQMWFYTDSDKHVCFEKHCRVWLLLSVQFTNLALGSWQGTGQETDLSASLSKVSPLCLYSQPTSLIALNQIKTLIQIKIQTLSL